MFSLENVHNVASGVDKVFVRCERSECSLYVPIGALGADSVGNVVSLRSLESSGTVRGGRL